MKSEKKKIRMSQVVLIAVLAAMLCLALFQLYIMLIKSVKSPAQDLKDPFILTFPFRWKNFEEIWKLIDFSVVNTLLIAVSVTFGSLLFASMGAYGLTRYRLPFKETIAMLLLSLTMIPGTLTLVSQYQLVSVTYNLANSYFGVIIPCVAGQMPMTIFLFKGFFEGVSKDIFDAGSIDGAGNLYMYFKLCIPLTVPILIAQGLMIFMGSVNEYMWPMLILRAEEMRTTAVQLVYWTNELYRTTMSMNVAIAGYVLASIPLLLLFVFCSRQYIEGLTTGSVKM